MVCNSTVLYRIQWCTVGKYSYSISQNSVVTQCFRVLLLYRSEQELEQARRRLQRAGYATG